MSRGKVSSKAQQARRQAVIAATLAGNPSVTQSDLADKVGRSIATVKRDLEKLRAGFNVMSRENFTEYIQQQVQLLLKAAEEVWEGKLPPEAANSIRGIMDSVARLTGSNAPTKSIHANVSGPQLDPLYLDIRQELLDLPPADQHEALQLMREFAKARKKPVVLTAMVVQPPALKEGD